MKKRCKNPHAVALQVRWLSPERGQETGQTRKRPQAGLVKSRKKRIAARRNAGRSQRRRRRNKRSSRFAPASDTAILARVMAGSALPPCTLLNPSCGWTHRIGCFGPLRNQERVRILRVKHAREV